MRIIHPKHITNPGDLDCSDYNSDHLVVEGIQLEDLNEVKLLGYTLVEEKKDLSGVDSVTFSGLNGDIDEEYLIETDITINSPGVAAFLLLLPNGVSSDQKTNSLLIYNGNLTRETTSNLVLSRTDWAESGHVQSKSTFFAKTGFVRVLTGKSLFVPSSTVDLSSRHDSGRWTNSTTLITSLVINTSPGTLSGTIRLWKKIPITGVV